MLFLFADVAKVATKPAAPAKIAGKAEAKQEMGTILELNQNEVLASYKGGTVLRKDVVLQLKATGIDLNSPQPIKMIRELEKRIALSLAIQKYVTTIKNENTLSAQDKTTLAFIKGQFITKRFLEDRTKTNISDQAILAYYKKLREKAQKETVYNISICVLSDAQRAAQIVSSLKAKPKASQKSEFTKVVHTDSLFEKKNDGALPPLSKERLQQFFSADVANKVVQYAKGSFIPQVFSLKGSSFLIFLDNVQKMGDSMPSVDKVNVQEVRPMLSAQIAGENRLPELKKIVAEGAVKVNGIAGPLSDEYLNTAVMP